MNQNRSKIEQEIETNRLLTEESCVTSSLRERDASSTKHSGDCVARESHQNQEV